jgi:putative ABC transport system ATP-binding protein
MENRKPETSPVLEARNLWVAFDEKIILHDLSFSTAPRESWAIVGGSHSGKSVLLKTLAGLIRPTRGHVLFRGKRAQSYDHLSVPWKEAMGYMSQNLGLRSNMTAMENAALPLLYHGVVPAQEAHRMANELLEQVGISDTSHRPAMLSPGERSLVALARALILDPGVILLDSPMVVLDVDYSGRVIQLLDERRRRGCAVVSVCSSETVAKLLATRTRRLRKGTLEEIA